MNTKTIALMASVLALAACGNGEKRKQEREEKNKKTAAEQTQTPNHVCRSVTDDEVAALFDRWNNALKTGKPANVVATYAKDSVLLPTLSDKVRYSPAEKEDYFVHFLEKSPVGEINERHIQIGCNTAFDAGVYTFTFGKTGEKATGRYSYTYKWDGKDWLITSHHSSLMPEAQAAKTAAAVAAAKAQAASVPAAPASAPIAPVAHPATAAATPAQQQQAAAAMASAPIAPVAAPAPASAPAAH